jgi:hypothetical protein
MLYPCELLAGSSVVNAYRNYKIHERGQLCFSVFQKI